MTKVLGKYARIDLRQVGTGMFCITIVSWVCGGCLQAGVATADSKKHPFGPSRCDPECLLQSPETSKFPKVVMRWCNRCFGQLQKGSPKSLLHQCNPVLHQCNPLLHQSSRLLVHMHQNCDPCRHLQECSGPGPESAPRSAFWAILGTCLGVPRRVLFECFSAF